MSVQLVYNHFNLNCNMQHDINIFRNKANNSMFGMAKLVVKVSVTQSCLFVTPWTVAYQAPLSMEFGVAANGIIACPYVGASVCGLHVPGFGWRA